MRISNTRLLCWVITIFYFVSCQSKGRRVTRRYPNGVIQGEIFYQNKNDLSTCEIKIFYPSGELHKTATMSNGQFVGIKYIYFRSGKIYELDSISIPCDTTRDLCDGIIIRYYENGKISGRFPVQNGLQNGLIRQYYKNGTLAKEWEVSDDSVKNGAYHEFYENGRKRFEATFDKDTITGIAYFFSDNGDTAKYYNNINGVNAFPYKKWLMSKRVLTGNYSMDKKSVEWVWYDSNRKELKKKKDLLIKKSIVVPE